MLKAKIGTMLTAKPGRRNWLMMLRKQMRKGKDKKNYDKRSRGGLWNEQKRRRRSRGKLWHEQRKKRRRSRGERRKKRRISGGEQRKRRRSRGELWCQQRRTGCLPWPVMVYQPLERRYTAETILALNFSIRLP